MINKVYFKRSDLYILFFIWPFGVFLKALKNIRDKKYHIFILLFSIVFGYSVFFYSGDILRYEESFKALRTYTWSDYFNSITDTYDVKPTFAGILVETQPDFYAITMMFLVSRFTNNPRWFFALISLIYTALYLQLVQRVSKQVHWLNYRPLKIFFIYFLVIIPFYVGVTGVRFWTAFYLYCLVSYNYINTFRIKYLWLALLTPFIHFSFIIPVMILFLYRFIWRKRLILSFIMFLLIITSALISKSLIIQSLNVYGYKISGELGKRVENYTNIELLSAKKEKIASLNWYVILYSNAFTIFALLWFILYKLKIVASRKNALMERLEPFVIIFFIITLFTFGLPSIARFKHIFHVFILIFLMQWVRTNIKMPSVKWSSYIVLPILVLHILVSARAGFYFVDPLLLVANPIVLLFKQSSISLSELIVGH